MRKQKRGCFKSVLIIIFFAVVFGATHIFMLHLINFNHHGISTMAKLSLQAIFEGENKRMSFSFRLWQKCHQHATFEGENRRVFFLIFRGRRNVYVGAINHKGIELNYSCWGDWSLPLRNIPWFVTLFEFYSHCWDSNLVLSFSTPVD